MIARYKARVDAMQQQLDAAAGHDTESSGPGNGTGAGRLPLGGSIWSQLLAAKGNTLHTASDAVRCLRT